MNRKIAWLAGMSIVVITGLAFWPVERVDVTVPRENDRLLASLRVGGDDRIRLTYRHSVELTSVEGVFKVSRDAGLLAVKTRMESVGTGLPNAAAGRTAREDGWLEVDEEDKPVGTLRFFLVPVNQTRLVIAGRPVDLTGLAPGTLIEVSAGRSSLFGWLFDKKLSGGQDG